MAEFCKCGSLMIGGRCTNKSCSIRLPDRQPGEKAAAVKKTARPEKAPAKSTRVKRASKCITYNLYDTQSEKENDS